MTRSTDQPEKIIFAVQMAEFINHYKNIWRHLSPEEFEIVFAGQNPEDSSEIRQFASRHGYVARALNEVEGKVQYGTVVSNHPFVFGQHAHFMPRLAVLGHKHVRLMYSLGKARWNFSNWNDVYDLVLTFGPFHEKGLGHLESARTRQVGYPRFDHYFRGEIDTRQVATELGLEAARKTVLWLPTWAELSSIDTFVDSIAALNEEFNLLVKVHPLTATREPARMKRLANAGIQTMADINRDNVELFAVADFVLCDYGGSAFGAIYMDKNLLLLNSEQAESDEYTGNQSMDVQLRSWIPNIGAERKNELAGMLRDDAIWADQGGKRRHIEQKVFAPNKGTASEVAAQAIRELHSAKRPSQSDVAARWKQQFPPPGMVDRIKFLGRKVMSGK
ncbi:MAG: CDP-glycerol--poly(glycerophosphate) glycerophosphotransferase [Xanthomonadales bacterium]|nr:CDP-glycerol--poly(glycerophosphate) glycerophosphotransferase [Xanthomonadales bacterium]